MPQADGLGQVLVQTQRPGNGARQLRHFQGVGQAGDEMVAAWRDEDLGLVFQAPEGIGVNDAVAVALKGSPQRTRFFDGFTAAASQVLPVVPASDATPVALLWNMAA